MKGLFEKHPKFSLVLIFESSSVIGSKIIAKQINVGGFRIDEESLNSGLII
jgi:hypothetical protein